MLRYGGVGNDEQEVTIRLDAQDGEVHVCSTWPVWSRKFEKRYGSPPKYQEREGFVTVAFWTLPLHIISLRALARKPATRSQTPRGFARSIVQTPTEMPVSAPIPKNRTYDTSGSHDAGKTPRKPDGK